MNLTPREEKIYEAEVLNGTPLIAHGADRTHFFCQPSHRHPTTVLIFHELEESYYAWADEYVNTGDADDAWIALRNKEDAYVADN